VFSDNLDTKYQRALATIGVEISQLVTEAGHA
jgi:putative AlgH/UPF0301 family transcriptional regulator